MKAIFIGTNSMKYKRGNAYILATTFRNGYLWAVDINGKGKPVPYEDVEAFLDNWHVLEMPFQHAEKQIMKEANDSRTIIRREFNEMD